MGNRCRSRTGCMNVSVGISLSIGEFLRIVELHAIRCDIGAVEETSHVVCRSVVGCGEDDIGQSRADMVRGAFSCEQTN